MVAKKLEHVQGIDLENIEDLKRSKKIVGELLPVIIARFPNNSKRIVSGRHRSKAGWKKTEIIDVKTEDEYWNLVLQYNVARKMTYVESCELFSNIAEAMSREGKSNKEIMKFLMDNSPFVRGYTYEFIPEKYKQKRDIPYLRETVSFPESSIDGTVVVDGTTIGLREYGTQFPPKLPKIQGLICPGCFLKLSFDPEIRELVKDVQVR